MTRYLPYPAGPHRLRVGTRTLPESEWIELGDDADAQLAEKRRLLRQHHADIVRVVDDAPGLPAGRVRAASAELLAVLTRHVVAHFPDRYARPSGTPRDGALLDPRSGAAYVAPEALDDLHPVDAAARLVPEDICLHLPGEDGRLRLVAASVAFPSRWVLAEKMGATIAEIHAPVPGYPEAIAHPVDQLLERLPANRLLWRLNGSVLDDAALFQPTGRGAVRTVHVPDDIVLRSERQTLRRLPGSGALVFTIRTRIEPLAALAGDAAACAQIAGWLRGLDAATTAYKSLSGSKPAVLDWLDASVEQSAR